MRSRALYALLPLTLALGACSIGRFEETVDWLSDRMAFLVSIGFGLIAATVALVVVVTLRERVMPKFRYGGLVALGLAAFGILLVRQIVLGLEGHSPSSWVTFSAGSREYRGETRYYGWLGFSYGFYYTSIVLWLLSALAALLPGSAEESQQGASDEGGSSDTALEEGDAPGGTSADPKQPSGEPASGGSAEEELE